MYSIDALFRDSLGPAFVSLDSLFCITYLAQRGNKAETNKKTAAQGEEAKQKNGSKKRKFFLLRRHRYEQKRVGAVTNIANWLGVQGFNLQKGKNA